MSNRFAFATAVLAGAALCGCVSSHPASTEAASPVRLSKPNTAETEDGAFVVSPADRRYDSAGVKLPAEYPARAYSEKILIDRLVAIAEMETPRLQAVEGEFGIRFVQGFARGQKPLGDTLSGATGEGAMKGLFLSFTNRQTRVELARRDAPTRNMCVNTGELLHTFVSHGWHVDQLVRGGHAGGTEMLLQKEMPGGARRVALVPFPDGSLNGSSGACLDLIQFLY